MTAVIALTAECGNTLPGILPLFPLFGFIALMIVGAKNDTEAFRETCVASAKTLPAYLAFVTTCYLGIAVFPAPVSVVLGICVWMISALMAGQYSTGDLVSIKPVLFTALTATNRPATNGRTLQEVWGQHRSAGSRLLP